MWVVASMASLVGWRGWLYRRRSFMRGHIPLFFAVREAEDRQPCSTGRSCLAGSPGEPSKSSRCGGVWAFLPNCRRAARSICVRRVCSTTRKLVEEQLGAEMLGDCLGSFVLCPILTTPRRRRPPFPRNQSVRLAIPEHRFFRETWEDERQAGANKAASPARPTR